MSTTLERQLTEQIAVLMQDDIRREAECIRLREENVRLEDEYADLRERHDRLSVFFDDAEQLVQQLVAQGAVDVDSRWYKSWVMERGFVNGR